MSKWQPFETAPNNRSEFLACRGSHVFVMYWSFDEACWKTAYGDLLGSLPTHWIPLPAGPDGTKSSADVAYALGQLRHLYQQLCAGQIKDQGDAARGLLGPAVETMERLAGEA